MVKQGSAGIIIYDKSNVNVESQAPKSQQLVLKQEKESPAAKVQGNNKFFIMNLKENNT